MRVQPTRLRSVTLREVPLRVRRRHGAALLRQASERADLLAALELRRAIEAPSDRRYLLPADAVDRVLG